MLQTEEEPNRKVSKSVMILEETPDVSSKDCYVNNAFEDGPQNTDKVNDNHYVLCSYSEYDLLD